MKTKTKLNRLWLSLGGIVIPSALLILFHLLKTNQALMAGWVFGVMAPLEQFFGRIWSVFPFSVAEVLTGLFLIWCLVWLVRAAVLVIRQKAPLPFLRRLLALASAWLWLWAGLCWTPGNGGVLRSRETPLPPAPSATGSCLRTRGKKTC